MSRSSAYLLCCILACAAGSLRAVEVVGDAPAWLAGKYRADWPRTPLKEVLAALAHESGQPVVPSAEVTRLLEERMVYQVDGERGPLRETLELLESTQDLHVIVEPLRLRVETAEELRDSRRRVVDLNLRDYGVYAEFLDHPVLPGPALRFLPGKDAPAVAVASDQQGIIDFLRATAPNGGIDLSGHGNIHVLATPEEEVVLRQRLDDLLATNTRRTSWRITFGTLPAEAAFPSGLVVPAEAAALAARLQGSESALLQAFNGQLVSGGRYRQQAVLAGAEIVGANLDPRVEVIITGHRAQVRPRQGLGFTVLEFAVDWLEPLVVAGSELHTAPRAAGPAEVDKEHPVAPPQHVGGTMTITKPAQWEWRPRGDFYLPAGKALVLVAEHPAGRALTVIEELP